MEAGRLEVEKARLEVELAAAKQRIQVNSFTGTVVISGSVILQGLLELGFLGGTGDVFCPAPAPTVLYLL